MVQLPTGKNVTHSPPSISKNLNSTFSTLYEIHAINCLNCHMLYPYVRTFLEEKNEKEDHYMFKISFLCHLTQATGQAQS